MSAVLVPFWTQLGVRSKIVLLSYYPTAAEIKPVWRHGLNRRIDPSNCKQILHTWFQTRWRKVCHSPDRQYCWKSCSLMGKTETKIWNLSQGNWSCKETWWNESEVAIKPHRWAVFGNLLKFHFLTRAWRPRRRRTQTSSWKSQQLRNHYGKLWGILSKTGPSTHAAREILGSP